MTNRKRFFYHGILLTVVGLAMRSVGMFFGALVSRAVGAEGVGLYTIIMTVYSFALTLAASGIGITVTKQVAEAGVGDGVGVGGVMRGAFLYSLIFGIFSFSVLFFGAEAIGERVLHDTRAVSSLKILSLSLLPSALSAMLSGYFVGIRRVGANAAVQVLTNAFKIGITLFFVLGAGGGNVGKSVFLVCLGITLTETLSFLLLFIQYIVLRKYHGKSRAALREVSRTALPLGFSAYIRSALLTVEHILIPKRLREYRSDDAAALSDYGTFHGMALPLVTYPMAPLSSFAGLLVPEFAESEAKGDRGRLSRISAEALSTTLTYAMAVSVFVYLFSEELGYVVYNSYEAGGYIAFLAPIIPIMYLDHVTDAMLKGVGEVVYSMWVNIADSLLSVLLVCILIPKMGILGYGLVIITMEAFNFILSFHRLKKRIKFSLSLLKSTLASLIAASLASYITAECFVMCSEQSAPLWLIFKLLFAVCIFIGVKIPIDSLLALLSKMKIRVIKTKKCK